MLFKTFVFLIQFLSSENVKTDNAFYLRPLEKRFSHQPVGHSTLERIMKDLMHSSGFYGYFTLHSLRATCATRLYEAGFEEQQIMEVTGHKSVAIREYKRTSDTMKRKASEVIQERHRQEANDQKEDIPEPSSRKAEHQPLGEISENGSGGNSLKRLKINCGELKLKLTF